MQTSRPHGGATVMLITHFPSAPRGALYKGFLTGAAASWDVPKNNHLVERMQRAAGSELDLVLSCYSPWTKKVLLFKFFVTLREPNNKFTELSGSTFQLQGLINLPL